MIETIDNLSGYTPLKVAAAARGVSREALYYYTLRRGIPLKKLGNVLLVDEKDLTMYRKKVTK